MNAHPEFDLPAEPLAPEAAALLVDLGIEPPIQPEGASPQALDRRGVSLRWLAACTLVGSCGAALLGAAILTAMRGDTSFPERPETVTARASGSAGGGARKADKLVVDQPIFAARHSLRAPMSQRVGDREVIRLRPVVRLASNLALTTGVYATNVPPFNPLRLFAESGQPSERYAEPVVDVPDADVTIVKRDLATIAIPPGKPQLGDAEVITQIEEERANVAAAGRQRPLPMAPQLLLSRTLGGAASTGADILAYAPATGTPRFSGIEVRVVPENVTNAMKTPLAASREPLVEDKLLIARRGENYEQVLRAAGASPEQIRAMIQAFGGRVRTGALPDGQVLQALYAPGPQPGDPRQIVRVSLLTGGQPDGTIAINDAGVFVPVTLPKQDVVGPQKPQRKTDDDEEDGEDGVGGARLYESLYETGLRHEMPRPMIDELVRIFSYDLDFQQRVRPSDNLEVIFTEDEEGERGEILSASLTIGGETRRVFRYQAPEDGLIEYFDDDGRSLKKFLLRKPISDGEMRSGFGMRYHPIMRYSKMHTGVDWANRIGTPILAAGNGTVIKAEWDSGYGRRIEIQHANGYVTAYSHQSAFAKGIAPGVKVRQGQIIGYLGNTGLSTGPHLHYEVLVNGNFVNPMKIRVPRGRELDGRSLAEFKRQREEIQGLIQRAGGTVAQLR